MPTATWYSPSGNPEIWDNPPEHYIIETEWLAQRQAEADAAEQVRLNDPVLARNEKYAEINNGCQTALSALTLTYPDRELLTFERQEREARALLAGDSATDVAHITAIAQGRGIPVEELAQKIIAKADAFALASGLLIGMRQKYEDQLNALGEDATAEQIRAITVSYSLPGADGSAS